MTSRELSYPLFDADNHLYETEGGADQVPSRNMRKNAIDYVEVHGRTKIAVRGQISEYIPNPTFDVVARPGAQEDYFKNGNPEGKSRREILGKPMKAIPAFREPAARLELMDELGIDYAPDVPHPGQPRRRAHEGRPRDDPRRRPLTQPVDGRDVVVQLPGPHLHHPGHQPAHRRQRARRTRVVLERGAKTVLVRPAPVPGYPGQPVVRHCRSSTRSGRPRRGRTSRSRCTPRTAATPSTPTTGRPAKREPAVQADHIPDGLAMAATDPGRDGSVGLPRCAVPQSRSSDRCRSRTAPTGCRTCCISRGRPTRRCPQAFREDPVAAFKRSVYVSPVLGGRLRRPRRADRRRPGALRFGLPPSRGPRGADSATSTTSGLRCRTAQQADHGRQS